MQAYFYNFAKRTNSTLTPAVSTGELLDIELKEQADTLSPVLLLMGDSRPGYNYVNIPALGRYYYITNERWLNGLWELSCKFDALTTYKAYIGITDHYVLRSSAEQDGNIVDLLYPVKTTFTETADRIQDLSWGTTTLTSGYYVVGINGKFTDSYPQAGAIQYFVMTPSQLRQFMDVMFTGNMNWYKLSDPSDPSADPTFGITDNLAKIVFNPFDYVKSIHWSPLAPDVGGTASTIDIGWWGIAMGSDLSLLADDPIIDLSDDIAIPKHPLSAERGNYLNSSRYAEYTLQVPNVGLVTIDANYLLDFNYIRVKYSCDPIEGRIMADIYAIDRLYPDNKYLIKRVYGNYGVDIDLTQASVKLSNFAGALTNTAAIAANPSAIGGVIMDFADMTRPATDTVGNNLGFISTADSNDTILYAKFYDVVDDDNTTNGRPLCKVRKPQELGGYMEVEKCEVSSPRITPQELEEIKTYMEGGFFYE